MMRRKDPTRNRCRNISENWTKNERDNKHFSLEEDSERDNQETGNEVEKFLSFRPIVEDEFKHHGGSHKRLASGDNGRSSKQRTHTYTSSHDEKCLPPAEEYNFSNSDFKPAAEFEKVFRGKANIIKQSTRRSEQIDRFEAPPPPPEVSLNLEDIEEKIRDLDYQLRKILKDANHNKIDLDMIEQKSEERRLLKNTLKKIKKKMKDDYNTVRWTAVHPKDIYQAIERQESTKPSFFIQCDEDLHEMIKESFGKFGTISKTFQLGDRLKIEFFKKSSAKKCLLADHPESIEFFEDPFPDFVADHPQQTSSSEIQARAANIVCSSDDFLGITFVNKFRRFRTEEEVYNYFVVFGSINNVCYLDGSKLPESFIGRDDEITVEFESKLSVTKVLNEDHEDITVEKAKKKSEQNLQIKQNFGQGPSQNLDDDKRYNDPPRGSIKSDPFRSVKEELRNPRQEHRFTDGSTRKSNNNRLDVDQDRTRGGDCGNIAVGEKRQGKVPSRDGADWKCSCGGVNFSERLRCYCGKVRQGNWVCPSPHCGRTNWSRSLYCFSANCHEAQPDTWHCTQCNLLNFPSNTSCYQCKQTLGGGSGGRNRSFQEFIKNAELDKQKEALEKVRMEERFRGGEEKMENWPVVSRTKDARMRERLRGFDDKIENWPRNNKTIIRDTEMEERFSDDRMENWSNSKKTKSINEKSSMDWGREFELIKKKNEKEQKENSDKARVVQNKLLAIACNSDSSPSKGNFSQKKYGFGTRSQPYFDGEVEVVSLSDSDDEINEPSNPNIIPIGKRKPKPGKLTNKVSDQNQPTNSGDGVEIIDQLSTLSPEEQASILKQFNIVQIVPPDKNKEVYISSDESDFGRYSEGSDTEKQDNNQQMIDKIVAKDLRNISRRNFAPPVNNDDDIIILDLV